MAIRITGMYSGLDTESIINELASAQSYKKTKLVKAQKKLSWKQDAWKALNTKIYSFYQKLDDMRLQSSYLKKKTTVSNPSAVKVTSGENTVDGVHTLTVDKMAKRAYLTGGSLETSKGVRFKGIATIKQVAEQNQLNFEEGSISVNGALGQSVKIDITEDMTINDFVDKLKAVGLNASFDQDNQRIYISSKDTGKDANFTLSGNDAGGFQALATLGLLTAPPAAGTPEYEEYKNTAEYKEYEKWAAYADPANQGDKEKLIKDLVAQRAAAYKAQNDALTKDNETLKGANKYNEGELKKLDGYAKYGDISASATAGGDYAKFKTELYDKIYGKEEEVDKLDEDGNPVKDDEGNVVKEKVRKGGLAQDLEAAKEKLAAEEAKDEADRDPDAIAAAKAEVERVEKEITEAKECYSFVNAIATNEALIKANEDKITENATYFDVDDTDPDNVKVTGSGKLIDAVTKEVETKANAAQAFLNGTYTSGMSEDKQAHKIQGSDAQITLNGVKYSSYNNTITVNGMTITALEETNGKEVTLSTTSDTDGIYDMIKGLFTEYNALINEMDSLYNAESSKGYDPLTSEEKDAMTDDEIEEWEKKIKDSLLRRDSTLSTVSSAMKSVMLQGVSVNGKTMYLSDFGIATLGYFGAKDNERNAYHIDGDQDDVSVRGKEDVLKSMIATDPDTVMNFFVGLTNNMHDELNKRMSATTLSSALTVYNDKQMKKEYDNYTDMIKKQEEKLNALMDKWYAKFSAMETALAKMESKNNAVSSMFGG